MTNKGNHSPTYIREICVICEIRDPICVICVICDSVFLREIREICESVIPSVIFPHP